MTLLSCRATAWTFGLILLTSLHNLRPLAAAEIRTVALSGQQAPGALDGVVFSSFSGAAKVNDRGQVSFDAALAGPFITTANDTSTWSDRDGAPQFVAGEGGPAPNLPLGVVFTGLPFRTAPTNDGRVVIFNTITGPGVTSSNNRGIWSNTVGPLSLIVRSGSQAPGTAEGVKFSALSIAPAVNDGGNIMFSSSLSGFGLGVNSGNDTGIWLYGAGEIDLLVREGTQAPGAPAGVNFGNLDAEILNNSAHTAFNAPLTGAGVTTANNAGIWSGYPGGLALKARTGDQAPGADSGVNFASLSTFIALNSDDEVAFAGTLVGSGVTASNETGIWAERNGSINLIAREGSPAAGVEPGVTYDVLFDPKYNGDGEVLFRASLLGPGISAENGVGIWSGTPGDLSLVVRGGDQAPGAPEGVEFFIMDAPSLNSAGQVAFSTSLAGAGVTAANDRGIWATDVLGDLRLIAREGDQLEVAPGDMRTINALAPLVATGEFAGRARSFNDRGQIGFSATFTDGTSGMFVSDVVKSDIADFTRDGVIDAEDLALWRSYFGEHVINISADGNADGFVDGADFLNWQRHVSQTAAAPTSSSLPAPEPSAALLLVSASATLTTVARRPQRTGRFSDQ